MEVENITSWKDDSLQCQQWKFHFHSIPYDAFLFFCASCQTLHAGSTAGIAPIDPLLPRYLHVGKNSLTFELLEKQTLSAPKVESLDWSELFLLGGPGVFGHDSS